MRGRLHTAGEVVDIDCRLDRVSPLLVEGAGGCLTDLPGPGEPAEPATIRLIVEADRRPFLGPAGSRGDVVTRGVLVSGDSVVFEDACASGFSLRVQVREKQLLVIARYRPDANARAAALALRTRYHLLTREVLLQYPALWWAGVRGRVPLHVSAVKNGAGVSLLAGPGGVGKSTLVAAELAAGAAGSCDNLAVSDGVDVFGLAEPIRIANGTGRRVTHGRRETPWPSPRELVVRPDRVVVVALGNDQQPTCAPASADAACRSLVTGTYMAGELRRYWAYAASLAAATGLGPAHPAVDQVAQRLITALPCLRVTLSRSAPATLGEMLTRFASDGIR
jgi:hypothetical protein